jgi:hypothetical protein
MKASAWVILLGVSLAAGAWFGGLVGYYLGAKQATEAWDTAVMERCANEVQAASELAYADCNAGLQELTDGLARTCTDLATTCTAISNDCGWRVEWMQDMMEQSSAAWLYSDQDPQRAYDLLWCASGTAHPLQTCLDMLVEGRK